MRSRIEGLAYWLWQQRGMPLGSPEVDWLLAEALLERQSKRADLTAMPLFAYGLERRTRCCS